MDTLSALEAQFKQIDDTAETDSVDVTISGDTQADATLTVSTNGQAAVKPEGAAASSTTTASDFQAETFALDLSEADVSNEYIDERIQAALSNSFAELPSPILQQEGATQNWKLVQDYPYSSSLGGPSEFNIIVFAGFVFDRSSIPRIVWPLISKDDLSASAPLLHDLLYRNGGVLPQSETAPHTKFGQVQPVRTFTRKDVDDLFQEIMKKSDVKPWRRKAAYQAVRKFGGFAWKGN